MTEPEQTEPEAGPVVKVARDLTEIEKLAAALEVQAVAKSNDRTIVGGAAMVALAHDADLDEWSELIASAELRHFEGPNACPKASHKDCTIHGAEHVEDEDDQDAEDPLRTLLFWSDAWREQYGYPLEGRVPTIHTEARFIRYFLDAAWRAEVHWEDFAKDVNRARQRLESILYAGRRAERTRVPCDQCQPRKKPNGEDEKAPNLIKVYAERKQVGVKCLCCGTLADMTERERCPVCWTHTPAEPLWASDEREDWWKCPSCKHRFDHDDFERAHKKHLRSEGARKFVPLLEAVATLRAQGRGERTIRKWLADKEKPIETRLTKAGLEVWWPDVWTRHLVTPMRQSKPRPKADEEPEEDPLEETLNEYRRAVRAAQQRSA